MDTAAIAADWRTHAVSPWKWRRALFQGGALLGAPVAGEGGGFYVTSDPVPRRTYLKPTKRQRGPFLSRAAREKIVSDLAHDLGIHVPPVMLYRRDDAESGDETLCCVSLVMYDHQQPWDAIKSLVVQASDPSVCQPIVKAMEVTGAHALALDAWVMQWDHNDHPNNIVCSYVDGAPRFVLLDYALALGHIAGTNHPGLRAEGWRRWGDEDGYKRQVPIRIPPHMDRYLLPTELETMIKRIEDFSPEAIRHIVQRIPDDFMDAAERDIVEKGLAERRSLIRSHLQARLP